VNKLRTTNIVAVVVVVVLWLLLRITYNRDISKCPGRLSMVSKEFDRLYGLVSRVSGYKSRGPGLDFWP
jgi:hypothetical protein